MWFSRTGNHPDGTREAASFPVPSVLRFQGMCDQRAGTRTRAKKNTGKAFCQHLPVCHRLSLSPFIGAPYLFRQPSGCPASARRHFAAPLPPEFHGRGFFTRPCHSIWLPPCCTSLFYGSVMEDSCFRPCRHFVCNYLKPLKTIFLCLKNS